MRKTVVSFEHESYAPGEVSLITGVNVNLQRDWRRRGFIADNGGEHARFTVLDVAHVAVLGELSRRGLMIWRADEAARIAAHSIADKIVRFARADTGCLHLDRTANFIVMDGENLRCGNDLRELHMASQHFCSIVIDTERFARSIAAKLPRPPVARFEQIVEEAANG